MPWWVRLTVIVGALVMGAGGVIALMNPAMLVAPGAQITAAAHVYAGYLVSRNLVLAAMLLAMLTLSSRGALRTLLLSAALIQFSDAVLDAIEGRFPVIPIVLVLGLAFLFSAMKLSSRSIWSAATWSQQP